MRGTPVSHSVQSGSIPLGNLDVLLAAAHMMPQQTDVPGLLRMVRYCTHRLMAFQRVCLMIETPLREQSRLYSLDVEMSGKVYSRVEMLSDESKYAIFHQADTILLSGEEMISSFPTAMELEVFKEVRQCLLQPLSVGVNGYHATLLFIWTGKASVNDTMPLCHVVSGIVAAALTQILHAKERNMEMEVLRKERDQLNMLVSIANVANSTLNLINLVDMLSLDLRRFFQVHDMALLLRDNADNVTLYGARSEKSRTSSMPRGIIVPLRESLLRRFTAKEPFRLLRENALKEVEATDPLAAAFLANGDKVVFGVSLVFQQTYLGVLMLAHSHADAFTRDATRLLSQVAVSVACAVHNALEYATIDTSRRQLAEENASLEAVIAQQHGDDAIIGRSEAIRQVLHNIDMVAGSDSNVLLLGETGTGKELVAEAIHRRSHRKNRPMVKINCAAVPAGLLESELFGYEKGAFTGAARQSKGRFELAHGSTLLLDEVGDLPLELQPKLLRILQSRELERLGGHTVIPVDVRLVAATNRNLEQMVQEGRFREDLYYRLNVFPIFLPPLRERREDIPLLAQFFMEQISKRMHKELTGITADTLSWLCGQQWPGNVRELANVIERAVICSTGKLLHFDFDVWKVGHRAVVTAKRPTAYRGKVAGSQASEDGRQRIIDAVRACNGLIAGPRGAAARLGVNRTTLNSRMKRLGLNVKTIMGES